MIYKYQKSCFCIRIFSRDHLLKLYLTILKNKQHHGSFLCRNIPLARRNVTNVILSYYIEVTNVLISVCLVPLIFVLCVEPLHFAVAQFILVTIYFCGSLNLALGSAVSCFQLLYVTKFEVIFSLDPQELGKRTFYIL